MKIFCVIPAYNEQKNIISVINSVAPLVDEVVVVDDCSTDGTYKLAETQTNASLLRHIINRGQGAALRTGTKYCLLKGADIIVHFDADGQFLAEEMNDVIDPIRMGDIDVVFGSRFLGKESQIPWMKNYIIMPLAKFVNLLLGVHTSDPQSGFRALSREAAKQIEIRNDGMAHCSEILVKAFALNLRVKEVPITVRYENFGQNLRGGFKILKELFFEKLLN